MYSKYFKFGLSPLLLILFSKVNQSKIRGSLSKSSTIWVFLLIVGAFVHIFSNFIMVLNYEEFA